MKNLILLISMLWGVAYGQCADEDTVRSNAVSLVTYNSARINGSTSHYSGTPTANVLIYVRVGHTDTATSTVVGINPLRNLTGLQPNTQYVYYYVSVCGAFTLSQHGRYFFTTASNTVTYTPMSASGYQYKYVKIDSGALFTPGDTSLGRAPNIGGQIKFKSSDSLFYYYNGLLWKPLAIDSFGIVSQLNNKVDSVTVSGDTLYYWKLGVGYGYILLAYRFGVLGQDDTARQNRVIDFQTLYNLGIYNVKGFELSTSGHGNYIYMQSNSVVGGNHARVDQDSARWVSTVTNGMVTQSYINQLVDLIEIESNAGPIHIQGTETVLQEDGGNVGIGKTGAAYTLDVAGSGNFDDTLRVGKARTVTTATSAYVKDPITGKVALQTISSGGISALTGDVTASGTGSVAATLATVNSNVGSFTNANITVNAKGLITAASNGSGGSSSNTSIGSAYKVAVNVNAANIKSIHPKGYLVGDSATTGEIGLLPDTTAGKLATQTMLADSTVILTNADNTVDTLLIDAGSGNVSAKGLEAGYGMINTSSANKINQKIDTANKITSRLQAQHLIDSLGAVVIVSKALSAITAATGTNTIDNTSYKQIWNWSTYVGSGSDGAMNLKSSSTAKSAASTLLNIESSGAQASSGANSTGIRVAVSNTGTTSKNVAAAFSATGATTNYAIIVPASGGTVGIGNSAPTSTLDVTGTTKSTQFAATYQTLTDGSTITWDANSGSNATVTIAATGRTLSISNPVTGTYYTVKIVQDGTGSRTITTWPTNTKWPGGAAPTLTTAANAVDIICFFYDGTNYYANYNYDFK